jgi:hypothetical protein
MYLRVVDNIPIEEAVYVLNISDGKFCDTSEGIAYISFFPIRPR